SLSGSPSSMVTGGTLVASWANISSPAPGDWIGLFPIGATDVANVAWMYTTGTATGSKSLQLPASLPAASYELRLFAHNTLQRLPVTSPLLVAAPTLIASPSTVLAGGTLTATWQGIPRPRSTDWLALVSTGAADASYKAWWYTNGSTSSSEVLTLP